MICQRSGSCCITMMVIIPVKEDGEWRAKLKPGNLPCPHLSHEGTEASCAVHEEEIFAGSPCWIYGNGLVDPDYAHTMTRPCMVGKMYQDSGGLKAVRPDLFQIRSVPSAELEDLGPFETNLEFVRGIPAKISQQDAKLELQYEDFAGGGVRNKAFDAVVLSVGMRPRSENRKLAEMLNLGLDRFGFFAGSGLENPVNVAESIYCVGGCGGPVSIGECLNEAEAVSGEIVRLLEKV